MSGLDRAKTDAPRAAREPDFPGHRKATTRASSSLLNTVDCGTFGPTGASAVVVSASTYSLRVDPIALGPCPYARLTMLHADSRRRDQVNHPAPPVADPNAGLRSIKNVIDWQKHRLPLGRRARVMQLSMRNQQYAERGANFQT